MIHLLEFEKALRHPDPHGQLRRLALELAAQGQTQRQVYDTFEHFRAYLRQVNREADEDVVLEVMDCIVGWCSLHAALFDSYLET